MVWREGPASACPIGALPARLRKQVRELADDRSVVGGRCLWVEKHGMQARCGGSPVKGKTYYVCCSGCRSEFNANPEKYIKEYEEAKAKKESEKQHK
jgi:hypothetical protein